MLDVSQEPMEWKQKQDMITSRFSHFMIQVKKLLKALVVDILIWSCLATNLLPIYYHAFEIMHHLKHCI